MLVKENQINNSSTMLNGAALMAEPNSQHDGLIADKQTSKQRNLVQLLVQYKFTLCSIDKCPFRVLCLYYMLWFHINVAVMHHKLSL